MSWSHEHADGEIWMHDDGHACDGSDFVPETKETWVKSQDAFMYHYPNPSQWSVNLNVLTATPMDTENVFRKFCDVASELRPWFLDHVNVSSSLIEEGDTAEEPEEFHDENTLVKVRRAITEALESGTTRSTYQATLDIITSMQNAGILFRERR